MTRFPLRYARQNILIGPGGEAAALYRADTIAYPFLPVSEKWGLLRRLERFAHLAGADFSIWRVQRAYPAERYAPELADLMDERHADAEGWRRYLEGHESRLRELRSHVPEVYIAVSLVEGGAGPSALRSFGRVRRRVEELAGVGAPRPISGSELEALATPLDHGSTANDPPLSAVLDGGVEVVQLTVRPGEQLLEREPHSLRGDLLMALGARPVPHHSRAGGLEAERGVHLRVCQPGPISPTANVLANRLLQRSSVGSFVDRLRHVERLRKARPVQPYERVADLEACILHAGGKAVVGAGAAEGK